VSGLPLSIAGISAGGGFAARLGDGGVSATGGFATVLGTDGTVWAWGDDSACQLGLGLQRVRPARSGRLSPGNA
jgi:alpha-tubulin suppressor-like RCC1 family protein